VTDLDAAIGAETPVADLGAALRRLHEALAPGADPGSAPAMLALLRALYAIGRRDLPLGRLFEGHVDAVQIVLRYGTPAQRQALGAALAAGAVLGVWGAALDGEPLRLDEDALTGGKSYASGADICTHALVTADTRDGQQLVLIDLAAMPPAIDRDWWRVAGMRRSGSHLVRWRHAAVVPDQRIGPPGAYAREPWFSGGALRFAAVQAGGIAALFDHTRAHLLRLDRAGDPHQAGRLAELLRLGEAAAAAVRRAAEQWFEATDDAARVDWVAAARVAVLDAGERAIMVAGQAVGLPARFEAHPLAAVIADLGVYLRQPAPDAQRMRVGTAAAAGRIAPAL